MKYIKLFLETFSRNCLYCRTYLLSPILIPLLNCLSSFLFLHSLPSTCMPFLHMQVLPIPRGLTPGLSLPQAKTAPYLLGFSLAQFTSLPCIPAKFCGSNLDQFSRCARWFVVDLDAFQGQETQKASMLLCHIGSSPNLELSLPEKPSANSFLSFESFKCLICISLKT